MSNNEPKQNCAAFDEWLDEHFGSMELLAIETFLLRTIVGKGPEAFDVAGFRENLGRAKYKFWSIFGGAIEAGQARDADIMHMMDNGHSRQDALEMLSPEVTDKEREMNLLRGADSSFFDQWVKVRDEALDAARYVRGKPYGDGLVPLVTKAAALEKLKVNCLCCGNPVKGSAALPFDKFKNGQIIKTIYSACCGKTETLTISEAKIAECNKSGGWTAFLGGKLEIV